MAKEIDKANDILELDYPKLIVLMYENDESERFLSKLENKIRQFDEQIELMCSANYKSFISCIEDLLQVRPTADDIKKDVVDINSQLVESAGKAQRNMDKLIRTRRVLVNAISANELAKKCQSVLEQYSTFYIQLEQKKYLPALKTLESLEREYLPTVSDYRFARNMCHEIPKSRLKIKEYSIKDLNEFLEGLLMKSQKIGEIVLKSAESLLHIKRDNTKDGSEELSALSLIDFGPVYRGLRIYSMLGYRDQFVTYYQEQREKQSRLAFSPTSDMSKSIRAYHDYFSSVIGFFVIEDHLMGTAPDFIQTDYLGKLWTNAIHQMTISLKQHARLCRDSSLMLEIKKLMMLFIFTIRNYGHNTDAFADILITIREQYNEILMSQWKEKFEQIFKQDTYHPLEVNNNEEYLKAVGSLSFIETEGVNFPKKIPFSLFVPKVYEEVRNFIEQSLKFSQDLNSSQADVENMVRKSTNHLLTDTLGSCLTALINDSSLKLLQLIQITINTDYLEDAMQYLDDHITYQISKTSNMNSLVDNNYNAINNAQVKLQGKSMFKDARADAEAQIYRKLNDQIDEHLDCADYNWVVTEPNGQASGYISDLIAWLKSIFQSFTNLPQPVAQGACMSACKHIAQRLRDLLLSESVKSISLGGLQQFNLDLMQCEHFAGSEPVTGFKEGDLQMAFAELRQLCDLFLSEDYTNYISDMGKQQNKYLRVTTATALNVVEKLREHDGKKTVFAKFQKNDKQKLRDAFAKSLRQVQQQQTLQNQQYQQQ